MFTITKLKKNILKELEAHLQYCANQVPRVTDPERIQSIENMQYLRKETNVTFENKIYSIPLFDESSFNHITDDLRGNKTTEHIKVTIFRLNKERLFKGDRSNSLFNMVTSSNVSYILNDIFYLNNLSCYEDHYNDLHYYIKFFTEKLLEHNIHNNTNHSFSFELSPPINKEMVEKLTRDINNISDLQIQERPLTLDEQNFIKDITFHTIYCSAFFNNKPNEILSNALANLFGGFLHNGQIDKNNEFYRYFHLQSKLNSDSSSHTTNKIIKI